MLRLHLQMYATSSFPNRQSGRASNVSMYLGWQTTKIGRGLNPDELIKLCKLAGAKRIVPEIVLSRDEAGNATETAPFRFQAVAHGNVPQLSGDYRRVFSGGVEES